MQAASLLDGFSFDLFPPFENGLAAREVDVSRRQVVQALVVSTVVDMRRRITKAIMEKQSKEISSLFIKLGMARAAVAEQSDRDPDLIRLLPLGARLRG